MCVLPRDCSLPVVSDVCLLQQLQDICLILPTLSLSLSYIYICAYIWVCLTLYMCVSCLNLLWTVIGWNGLIHWRINTYMVGYPISQYDEKWHNQCELSRRCLGYQRLHTVMMGYIIECYAISKIQSYTHRDTYQ